MSGMLFACILCVAITLTNICHAYNILLVFPFPGKSHLILSDGYVRHLSKAGHQLTHITPMPVSDPPHNLRQIDVSSNFQLIAMDDILNIERAVIKKVDILDMNTVHGMMFAVANATVMHADVQALLGDPQEKFDVVIVEWLYSELYAGFSTVFNCPFIWSSTMEVNHMALSLIDEDSNPAYSADLVTGDSPPFTFVQRVKKLWSMLDYKIAKMQRESMEQEIFEAAFRFASEKRGYNFLPLSEVKYNASLMLGNSHVSTGQALRLPQNYKPIGGYHIKEEIDSLPDDLQLLFDNAPRGVIYFSMGSMLKSASLPDQIKNGLLAMFSELNQTIVWKFEIPLKNLPPNVHIIKWAPQNSILAHPNCVLFITHGGILSTTEAVHFGVPVIGIPMYADQFSNVIRAERKGYGKKVDLNFDIPGNLKGAIEEILKKPSYRNMAKELSLILHDRLVTPGSELVHWVEHVVRTRGAPHLRSPALHVPWYQKVYLDLAALIVVSLMLFKHIIKILCCYNKNNKSRKQKTN